MSEKVEKGEKKLIKIAYEFLQNFDAANTKIPGYKTYYLQCSAIELVKLLKEIKELEITK